MRIKSTLAWVMLAQGVPIVYYGTEQNLLGHQPKAGETGFNREKGQVFLFSLWKKSHEDLKKFMMKQIDTMTCTRCNYPAYFKHVLDAWFFSAWQRA